MTDTAATSRKPGGITTGRAALILAIAIFFFGINWPTLKIVLHAVTPLWFNALRMLGAALVYALVLAVRGRLRWPARQDMPMVLGLGWRGCNSVVRCRPMPACCWCRATRSIRVSYVFQSM